MRTGLDYLFYCSDLFGLTGTDFDPRVQVHGLLHDLVCGEAESGHGHCAQVVDEQTTKQSPLDSVLQVNVSQGGESATVARKNKK